ncbi:MAG: efflux RND transporter periplasmic adaptor subunit [Gammaproteobacteria bacterium]|nr:efflux RND transporter periplasmic adaptor subunit [Gammaproteobacteria bacterium]
MSRRRIAYILAAVIGAFILFKIGKSIFIMIQMKKHHGLPPAPVEIAKAVQQEWQNQIQTTGSISAIQGVTISPEVAGRVTKIYFTSGTDVKKGDPLFQIYPDILQAQLENNQAALSLAQVNYNRAAALYQKRVISQEQLDSYTTQLEQAQATLDQTKAQLVQHNILAPFSGRIGLKTVDVGNYVNVGEDLVSLQQINPLRIDFNVPDSYIDQLKIGDKVEVTPSSSSNNTLYVGSVYAFNSSVDPSTRSFSMWAKIPNPNENLIPGTYVDVTLYVGQAHPVITIPQTAALFSPQGEYAYKVVDGKAVKTEITVGLRQADWIEVKSGLQAGDSVISAGQVKVFDGSPIVQAPSSTYAAEAPPKITYVTFPAGDVAGQAPDTDDPAAPASPASVSNSNTKATPAPVSSSAIPASSSVAAAATSSAPASGAPN